MTLKNNIHAFFPKKYYPIEESHDWATKMGYISASNHNDEVDAFRHIYTSALVAKDSKLLSYVLGLGNEIMGKNQKNETNMDLHNNKVGLNIATKMNQKKFKIYK